MCLLAGRPANETHQNLGGRGGRIPPHPLLPALPLLSRVLLAPRSLVLFTRLLWALCPQSLPFPLGADLSFWPYRARWPCVSSSGAVINPHELGSLSAGTLSSWLWRPEVQGQGAGRLPAGASQGGRSEGLSGVSSHKGSNSILRGHTGSPTHTLPLGVRCQHVGWAADTPLSAQGPPPRHPFPSLDVSFSDQCHLLKDKCGEPPRLTAGRKPSPLPPPPRFGSAPRRRGFAFPAGLLTQPLFSVTGLKGRSSQGQQVHTRGSSAQGPHPENEIWRKHAPAHR